MPLTFTLAFRNLFHDRLRLVATVIGIVFSIVLVMVQMGLYLGFGKMVTTMIDNASADLWVMPKGTKCFEDPSLLDTRQRSRALSVPGVGEAIPVVIGFADWRTPAGSSTPVFVVGSDLRSGGLQPWNLIEGRVEALSTPNAVAVDKTYFDRLGISGLGARAEIRQQGVRVAAVTEGIRSFTTTPYVFMDVDRARSYTGVPSSKATYFLIRIDPGSDVGIVRKDLQATLGDVEVLTPNEFGERSRSFWLFGTGAGAALFAGALLGVIVGTVIVAQTLYSSTKDHINEFARSRDRLLAQVHLQGHHLAGDAQRGDRLRPCGACRMGGGESDSDQRAADRHYARAWRQPVSPHRRDVRRLGHRRDHEGDADRSSTGVHAMSGVVMEALNVEKVLGTGPAQVRALKGVSLTLRGGELTLLMGPSGSGKTTLLSILGCMLSPTEGTVRVRGEAIEGKGPEELAKIRRENIGFVFQSYHLFPTLTAADNVRLALDVRDESGRKAKNRPRRRWPVSVSRKDDKLSEAALGRRAAAGGDRARGGRRAVGGPCRRADRSPRRRNGKAIMGILAEIAKDPNRGVLVVTHDPRLVPYADRIVHIEDGNTFAKRPAAERGEKKRQERPKNGEKRHGHRVFRQRGCGRHRTCGGEPRPARPARRIAQPGDKITDRPSDKAPDKASDKPSSERRWLAVAPGRIEPPSGLIKVAAPGVGIVSKVLVKVNDTVFAGEPLILLNDDEIQSRYAAAESQAGMRKRLRDEQPATGKAADRRKAEDAVADAETAVFDAQMAVDRAAITWRSGGGSNESLTNARSALARAQDELGKRQAQLRASNADAPLPTPLEAQVASARGDLAFARVNLETFASGRRSTALCCRSTSTPASLRRRIRSSRS